MKSDPSYAFWFLLVSAAATLAAGFSAWAAVSIRNLTKKLVKVTEQYANTVHEELVLLQRGAEPKLFLDAGLLSGPPNSQCSVTCIHVGAASSHPVLIERVETALESVEAPSKILASDAAQFHDLLHPGKRWSKVVSSRIGLALGALPHPNIFQAIARWKWERRLVAYLTVRVEYRLAGELKPAVEKQFEVVATPFGEALKAVG